MPKPKRKKDEVKYGDAVKLLTGKRTTPRAVKAIWKLFGGDYEAERKKQEVLFATMQAKMGKGPPILRTRKRAFLKTLGKLDTQKTREENVATLDALAKLAHSYVTDTVKGVTPAQKLRWARIEAYVYQVMNQVMKAYDAAEIKAAMKELRQMIEDERKRTRANA